MNGIYQHYIIDMSSNNNFVQVPTVQGDGNGVRGFEIELIQNGVQYQIDTDDVIISIMGTKADTTGIFNECSLTKEGYVLVDITSQMSAVKGRGDYEIVLMSRSKNSQLKSFPFFIITTPSSLDIDYLISSDEFQTLTKRIIECDEALEDMQELEETVTANENERIEHENTRNKNEQTRQDNEATRKSNESQRQKNEQERQDNENTRKDNEDQRITNEAIRNDAENVREANELIRQNNETVREQNENTRQDNESVRESNEDGRIENESKRINSEDIRESNEVIRQDNEETRQQNESIRQQNEQSRDDSESERQANEKQRKDNENTRETSETERNTNEDERIAAENDRQDNEAVRKSNESLREDAESMRKDNELARQSAESIRIDAENERKNNEINRQNAEVERQETFKSLEKNINEGLDRLDVTNETAKNYADLSKSYAVGTDNEVREGDKADNAKNYYEQCMRIAQGLEGALLPMGTITFEELETAAAQPGYMYNISNAFVSDDRFKDGAGIYYGAGNNVYYTAELMLDVMAAIVVTGVKGSEEETYRQGNVNITKENIGLGNVDNTPDSEKTVAIANNALRVNGYSIMFITEEDYQSLTDKDSNTFYCRPKPKA